jgi:lysophospholipase L1-like esterase
MLGTLMLVPVWLLTRAEGNTVLKSSWKLIAFVCAGLAVLVWLGAAYSENQRPAFLIGLVAAIDWLLLWKASFALRPAIVQAVNTVLLLVLGVPMADLALHHAGLLETDPRVLIQYRSYRAAHRQPAAFERWWNYLGSQWPPLEKAIMVYGNDPDYRLEGLRPNSQGTYVESKIVINSKGFRGKELPEPKGDAYRIVVLGESTTFGFTMGADEKTWPELLEQMLCDRLKPSRPVQVINAGVPGIDLPHNIRRLQREILPLKPDLVLCYHGYNCFGMLDKAIPPPFGKPPPVFRDRPIRLLANCEYRLKLLFYRQNTSRLRETGPQPTNLLDTDFARSIEQLIGVTRTNGIHLAVGNFSMAANEDSPAEVVEFYRHIYLNTHRNITANAAFSMLLRQLAPLYPDVCMVDTHPHLDGDTEKYFDLIHFTEAGDQQLAENFFAGIRPLLEQELATKSAATPKADISSAKGEQPVAKP